MFLKTAVLASTRTCQKRRFFGEYSNLLNSLASGHCLVCSQCWDLKDKRLSGAEQGGGRFCREID
jgi:hypothetical protein